MATYIPDVESQRDENAPLPWTNCNPASQAMLLDNWSFGRLQTSDMDIRRVSGVPVSRGMNFRECGQAIKSMFDLDLLYSDINAPSNGNSPMTWDQLRIHLSSNSGAVVCGDYRSLWSATNTKGQRLDRFQPGGNFGHAMYVCNYRVKAGLVLLMDPMGHGTYEGDDIDLGVLWSFIWKRGNDSDAIVTAAHGFSQPRPEQVTTISEREERLAKEVVQLRKELPAEAKVWHSATGLHYDNRGKPLRRVQYLAGEALFLRRAKAAQGK